MNRALSKILNLVHYIIIVFNMTIAFHPLSILKYTYLIPLFLFTLWAIFSGCPLTHATADDGSDDAPNFIHSTLTRLGMPITKERCDRIVNFYVILTVYISFWRLYRRTK